MPWAVSTEAGHAKSRVVSKCFDEEISEIIVKSSVQTKAKAAAKPSRAKPAAKRGAAVAESAKKGQRAARSLLLKGPQTSAKLTVTFGEVSVQVTKPSEKAVQKGVKTSAKVIRDLGKRLLTPGVQIKPVKGVPVLTADPHDPKRVIRQLNGKSEVGHFVRGQFKADTVSA